MSDREEIDAARVEAICAKLKVELPKLVAIAFAAFKKTDEFAVGKLAATLTDAQWKRVKRAENQRRARARI